MEKIALVTDTAADLPDDIIKKYNIFVLPFRIIYKDREYRDKVEITPKQVYDNMVNEIPTSSMPSMGDMETLFTKLEDEGYTHVIAVTLSSGLSGVYNGLRLVSENHKKINTYVYDSKSISMGEGIIILECAKLLSEGKNFDELVKALPVIYSKMQLFFMIPTLEYLKKGGRIGRVAGTLAEMLDIKPIITPAKDGKYITYAKVRGWKQALNKLISIGNGILSKKKYRVCIMEGGALQDASKIYNAFVDNPNAVECFFGGNISSVACVHTGPGLVGVVFYEAD